ncbi:MAG: hypothetical protein WCY58_09545 [Mariniphaga sp.]
MQYLSIYCCMIWCGFFISRNYGLVPVGLNSDRSFQVMIKVDNQKFLKA